MAFVADVFQSSTGTGTDPIVIPLPNLLAAGMAPKVVFLWMTGTVAPGDNPTEFAEARDISAGRGWAVSAGSRSAYGISIDHAAATTLCRRARARDCVLIVVDVATAAIVGKLDISDMSTIGQLTLVPDDAFPSNYVFHGEVWGGSSITGATITQVSNVASIGTQSVVTSNVPRYIEILGNYLASGTDISTSAVLNVGRCWGPTLDQHIVSLSDLTATAAADTGSYGRAGEVHALPNQAGGDTLDRYSISAILANGFTLNRIESAAVRQFDVLSVAGTFEGAFGVLSGAGIESGDPIPVPTGISAKVHNVWSICAAAASAADTTTVNTAMSMGSVATVGGEHVCSSLLNVEGADPTTAAVGFSRSHLFLDLTAAGAIEGAMTLSAPDEYTAVIPPPADRYVMWAAFGDVVPPATAIRDMIDRRSHIPHPR